MARVLVIDNGDGAREGTGWAFGALDHEVVVAEAGAAAVRSVEKRRPEVVVVDVNLSDVAAVEILHAIRAGGADSACVVVTGFETVEAAVAAFGFLDASGGEVPTTTIDLGRVERGTDRSLGTRSDGLDRWVGAMTAIIHSANDPTTIPAWASLCGVAPETLRGWCRTVSLAPKKTLDLARMLRAARLARLRQGRVGQFLRVADRRTLRRLLASAGLHETVATPRLAELLARQTFVADRAALNELRIIIGNEVGADA